MNKIGEGLTAEVFEWEVNSIIKLFRKGFDHLAQSEYKILQTIEKYKLGSPKAIDMVVVDERNGVVMSMLSGKLLFDIFENEPTEYVNYSNIFAKAHYALNSIVPDSVGLPNLKQRIKGRVGKCSNRNGINIEKILEILDEFPDEKYLCHNDFHPKNMMINNGVNVFDWGGACIGDYTADIAKTIVLISIGPPGIAIGDKMHNYRHKFLESYINYYSQYAPINLNTLEKWKIIRACELACQGVEFKDALIDFICQSI